MRLTNRVLRTMASTTRRMMMMVVMPKLEKLNKWRRKVIGGSRNGREKPR